MIEGVGHEYMSEFFSCCESLLAEDGVFVLQVIIFVPLLWFVGLPIYRVPTSTNEPC
jgi:hypothetical protein